MPSIGTVVALSRLRKSHVPKWRTYGRHNLNCLVVKPLGTARRTL